MTQGNKTMEEIGNDCFHKLVDMLFFQKSQGVGFIMHDIKKLLIYESMCLCIRDVILIQSSVFKYKFTALTIFFSIDLINMEGDICRYIYKCQTHCEINRRSSVPENRPLTNITPEMLCAPTVCATPGGYSDPYLKARRRLIFPYLTNS